MSVDTVYAPPHQFDRAMAGHAPPHDFHGHATASDHDHDPDSDGDDDDDTDLKLEIESTPSSRPSTPNAKDGAPKPATHMQKRRRVTRACDECRRKKIKCDGKQPCTHCTVYSYDCTYDQPSNRRRNPAPQYVESLERRVHRAESLLHILIPNLDLNDPGIDAAVAQGWIPGAPGKGNPAAAAATPTSLPQQNPAASKPDTNLESMVRAVGQLDMDEQGHWDYHGHSSGLSFMRRMREQLGDMMGPDGLSTPFVKTRPFTQVFDSLESLAESPGGVHSPAPTAPGLPPVDVAREMCGHAVDDATSLLRIVHLPSFWESFEKLYQTPPDQYTAEQLEFLPLFHSAMALGHLFGKDESSSLNVQGYENAIQRGFAHFKAARTMMDIADCRDLPSIQAVAFMILFLQSSAKLSQCYAYVGVALRSALRMGLHRACGGDFDPIEAETRKRVFWLVRKMDIYIGAMLGLPQTLSDEDIDQDFPLEVDDEYITKHGILPQPVGQVSLMTAFNAHTRLVQLLQKICRRVYPIKIQGEPDSQDKTYSIPFSAIREIESDLERWKNILPSILSPGAAPARYTRIQQLLRLSYAHTQVMLYRPFLHYVAMEKRSQRIDQRAYACAASYVNVSRNIIHITSHMKQKGLLNGAHWFIMYTAFFSILSLVYFAAENQDNPTTQAVMHDALEGKQVLASLSKRSMAADRCTATLKGIFQRLPGWMRDGQQNPVTARKRQLEHGAQESRYQYDGDPQPSRSHPDIAAASRRDSPAPGQQKRASTFPRHGAQLGSNSSPSSHGSPWSQPSATSFGTHTSTSAPFDVNAVPQINALPGGAMPLLPPPGSNFATTALPDLSTIMFPTADEPFTYPNQPLTTFENARHTNPDGLAGVRGFEGADRGSDLRPTSYPGREDELEAQYFALPPYFEQRQQGQQRADQGMAYSTMDLGNTPSSMPQMASGGWNSQTGLTQDSINIGDIFGGTEWNPMLMNPGYQNQ